MHTCGTTVLDDNLTDGELSSTQCAVSPLDLSTVSLSLLNLRTVDDCSEDSAYHNSCLLI